VQRREQRRDQVVAVLAASLSMAGESIAVVVVLALKVPPEHRAVVVCEDEARVATRLDIADPVEDVVRRMLGVADQVLRRGRRPKRSRCRSSVIGAGANDAGLSRPSARVIMSIS
jgi:hypothetical protein